jgi:thymidylate synthase
MNQPSPSPHPPRPIRSQYEDFLRHVWTQGVAKSDRTGTGTRSVFGYQMRFDLHEGFPLVTTKKVFLKAIIVELLWFLQGDSQRQVAAGAWLHDLGRMGPRGRRPRPGLRRAVAQLAHAQRRPHRPDCRGGQARCSSNPDSRRIIVSAWNVAELDQMALMPCHAFFQFYVAPATEPGGRGRLSCQLYQRSADIFLGVPFNIASYALLTHMLAQQCDLDLGDFIWTGGDCHIYRQPP